MPNKELIRLARGFKQFRDKFFVGDHTCFSQVFNGFQAPKTLVIGCCDSRVDPAILFSAGPGELFVVRNVANLVPPFEPDGGHHGISAAIEFAVVNLKVENLIVLGHRQCSGIRALLYPEQTKVGGFVHEWVRIAEPAKVRAVEATKSDDPDHLWRQCELESLRTSIENLRTFPFIDEAEEKRGLYLVGIYFDIETGDLLELDDKAGKFSSIKIE